METSEAKRSFWSQIGSFPANFWYANVMEALERLAFFGVKAVAPLYLVASSGQKGLGLDFVEKGIIFAVWPFLQCMIPMISGGYTDRYGYRKSLAVAFTINILGYVGMAQSKPIADALALRGWENPGFWVFLIAACLIGTGTAIFKPPVHGTIARTTDEETSSLGWGVFYWVVNIGGALAPMCAAVLRKEIDWDIVFYAAAIVTALNFLPAFLLYKEPEKEPPKEGDASLEGKSAVGVFISSIATIFKDLRLVVFLAIFSCFWLMFMQLWDLLPNFIDEWVDTSGVAPYFAWFSEGWVLENGQTKPEMIINIDAISIILFVIPISWLIARISKIAAMIIGMMISLVGFVGAGVTSIGWLCCLMVFVFSIGEMACSPTFSAYVGLIAPKDKKALYMGYSNIPFAVGWAAGGLLGGFVYEAIANKTKLARQYLVDHLSVDPVFAMDEQLLPKERVMETMAFIREGGVASAVRDVAQSFWDGVGQVGVLTEEQSREFLVALDGVLGGLPAGSVRETTELLWDMHHPYMVWYYLGAVGLLGTIGMIAFYFITRPGQAQAENA
ncbi:MAG: MFS transporter [Phycisphaerales bacterium]|nr:MAG: MFS transporter [Phycisphaerales bacterium]